MAPPGAARRAWAEPDRPRRLVAQAVAKDAPDPATAARRAFWRALDRVAARRGQPVAVLLTSDWHDRSARAEYDRYQARVGASIWAPAAALAGGTAGRLNCRPTHPFGEGDALPEGIRAYPMAPPWYPEVALYVPGAGALVVADAIWRTPDGDLRLRGAAAGSLRRLVETLPIDVLLLSHGARCWRGAGRPWPPPSSARRGPSPSGRREPTGGARGARSVK